MLYTWRENTSLHGGTHWDVLVRFDHGHLREIDCSLAVIGGPATVYSHVSEKRGQITTMAPHAAPKSILMWWVNIINVVNKASGPGQCAVYFLKCIWV